MKYIHDASCIVIAVCLFWGLCVAGGLDSGTMSLGQAEKESVVLIGVLILSSILNIKTADTSANDIDHKEKYSSELYNERRKSQMKPFDLIAQKIDQYNKSNRYQKIIALATSINDSLDNSLYIDYRYYSTDKEFVVLIFPPEWVNDTSKIVKMRVEELQGETEELNQIKEIENYLKGLLGGNNHENH